MLVLCSNGLTGQKLFDEVKSRMHSKTLCAAVVVTADNEYKERNYHVPHTVDELSRLGLSSECFDLDGQSPELLLNYDAVTFIGGNPYYLLDSLRRTNAKPVLEKLAREKTLIGWSASALVMGPSLGLIDIYSPEMNFLGLRNLTAMRLTDIYILPHYSKFINRYKRFEERCREFEAANGCEVLRLNDGEGIVVDGENVIVCKE